LKVNDPEVWLCLCVCCALADEYSDCQNALSNAKSFISNSEEDVRIRFCDGTNYLNTLTLDIIFLKVLMFINLLNSTYVGKEKRIS
jgi:hypothetical protein